MTELEELKRVDLQLIAMIDDAIERLSHDGIKLETKFLMMGFSGSGMFTNRFAIIHPERIQAAAIGAPGGWPILPIEEWNGLKLRYPVGVWDLEELVGHEFDIQTFKSIPQYFYMGDEDDNDAVDEVPDRFGVPLEINFATEDSELVFQQFGDTPVKRWPIAEEIYKAAGCSCQFVLYPREGHRISSKMIKDVLAFFADNMDN